MNNIEAVELCLFTSRIREHSQMSFDLSDGPAEVGGEIRLPANAPGGWILVREPKAPPVTDWHDPVGRHDGTVATMPVKAGSSTSKVATESKTGSLSSCRSRL